MIRKQICNKQFSRKTKNNFNVNMIVFTIKPYKVMNGINLSND